MSARQIKRLMALQAQNNVDEEENEESEEEEECIIKPKKSAFAALMSSSSSEEEDDSESSEESTSEDDDSEPVEEVKVAYKPKFNTNKKNKKNNKKKVSPKGSNDVFDQVLDEFKEQMNKDSIENDKKNKSKSTYEESELDSTFINLKSVLNINKKNMNDTEELKLRFGDIAVNQIEEDNHRSRRYINRRTYTRRRNYFLMTPTPQNFCPPSYMAGGIDLSRTSNTHPFDSLFFPRDYDRNSIPYSLRYSPEYMRLQEAYDDLSLTFDYNTVIQFFAANSYHLDSALASCEIFLTTGQVDEATKVLRQVLYIIENTWELTFDVDSANNRIYNNNKQDKSIFRAFFLYMFLSSRKGCYYTAFEICKLLWSLDPQLDQQGAILLLDYYAISSNKTQFIIKFCENQPSIYLGHISLLHLPNWSYSYAMALFREGATNKAKKQLKEALITFPQVLLKMKDKLKNLNNSLIHDDLLDSSPFCIPSQNDIVDKLMNIYVNRNFVIWQDKQFLSLFNSVAQEVISEFDLSKYTEIQEDIEREYDCQKKANEELAPLGFGHFFNCNPSYFTDELPHIDINELFMDNARDRMHIPTNLPLDHNALALFIESLAPWYNANETNDIENGHHLEE
ncbi:hypothetical protein WA158_003149 [Blastocystis sp. Blastoise]